VDIQGDATSTDCSDATVGEPPSQPGVVATGRVTSPVFEVSARLDGFWPGEESSGPYRRLSVVCSKDDSDIQAFSAGDVLMVRGDVKEFFCMAEMVAGHILERQTTPHARCSRCRHGAQRTLRGERQRRMLRR
jgi:hypothetical protein